MAPVFPFRLQPTCSDAKTIVRAGSAFGSGALTKDIPSNSTEFHEVHVFGMLVTEESLATPVRSPSVLVVLLQTSIWLAFEKVEVKVKVNKGLASTSLDYLLKSLQLV